MSADDRKLIEELVQRCIKVGWSVAKNGRSHWRVDTRHGVFVLASTPNRYSYRNGLADANRYGLEALEARMEKRMEKERVEKIAVDRARNDALLLEAEASAQLASTSSVQTKPSERVEPAMFQTPVMSESKPLKNTVQVTKHDGTVVFRCTVADCGKEYEKIRSAAVHQSWHSSGQRAVNRKVPHKKAASKSPSVPKKPVPSSTPVNQLFDRLIGLASDLVNGLKILRSSLPDPEITEKARKYDAMRDLMQ